ncbi:hypothetical protein ITX31_06885 [Arthrobacter gandavensis]|uniref:hypothetical protein n=1 Tax=Arthrobacter gandavensis TaxID=169960 RepID=UPI00188F1FD4|nr:hypothetical protein [Arthrobacter gandavensis]MBF4993835.1 hypothetical protein [Arthrobacter gandavensis]
MSDFPAAEPRLEPFASQQAGEPLEALSGLAATQDFRSEGPWLTPAAQDVLLLLGRGGKLGRFGLGSAQDGLEELVAAGLATGRGGLTAEGRLVVSPLGGTSGSVQFTAGSGGGKSAFYGALGSEGVLVLAGPSGARLRMGEQAEAGQRQVDFLSLDQFFPALAAWLGLGPSWLLDAEVNVSPAAAQARMSGASGTVVPLPDEADAAVRHMWEQEWFIWQQVGGRTGLPTGIQAGSAGTWQLVNTASGLLLKPWPSAQAYRGLLQTVSAELP